jgi:hypothetical protein
MKQKEFEREVNEKMGAFNMQPSDEVWVEVERRIRKEKKRRFIFWWPVFALLLAGGAGIYFLSQKNKKGSNETEIVKSVSRNNQDNKEKNSLNNEVGRAEYKKEEKISVATDEIQIETTVKKDGNNIESIKPLADKKAGPVFMPEQKIYHQQVAANIKKSKEDSMLLVKTKLVNPVGDLPITDIPEEKNQVLENNPVDIKSTSTPQAIKADTVATAGNDAVVAAAIVNATKKDTVPVIDTVVTIKQNKKGNHWQWGAGLFAGSSSLAQGFGILNKSFSLDAYSANPVSSLSSFSSSPVINGASFSISAFAQKTFSDKLDLKVTAGYTYLSWKFIVGAKVDSVISQGTINIPSGRFANGFYRTADAGAGNKYSNNYHLLGLSAQLSWKIIQGKKLKLFWDNGIGYNRLVGSSMLHYSSIIPGYYKDNSQLAKNHIFFSTGLSLNWGGRFYIGPALKYSFTPVLNNKAQPVNHFNSFGINTRFLFKK